MTSGQPNTSSSSHPPTHLSDLVSGEEQVLDSPRRPPPRHCQRLQPVLCGIQSTQSGEGRGEWRRGEEEERESGEGGERGEGKGEGGREGGEEMRGFTLWATKTRTYIYTPMSC